MVINKQECEDCAVRIEEIERLESIINDLPSIDDLKAEAIESLRDSLSIILEWGCAKGANIIDLRGRTEPELDNEIREWGLLREPARQKRI